MKLWGKFFLAIFALSLLSYGISGAAYAAVEPLSVTTNKEFYAEGGTITISGFVKNFDASDPQKSMDVSITIWAPNGNLATIAQISPSSDGNYSTTVKAAGMISAEGDYTVKAKWGAQENQTMFKYGGSSGTPPPEAEQQAEPEPEAEPEAEPEQ